MISGPLKVNMLGVFSIELDGKVIDDTSNRAKKLWLLLAYLIYNRNSATTQGNMMRVLWSDEDRTSNPLNALKTTLHRARMILSELGETAGHDLIVRKDGNYIWNNEYPVVLDVEEFERLYKEGLAEYDSDAKLDVYLQALSLYQGDFLEKLSMETWVFPINTYYRRVYLELALDTLSLLKEKNRQKDIIELCQKVLAIENYNEGVYRYLMQAMTATGDRKGVISVYKHLREQLFSSFGVVPAEDIQKLYFDALNTDDNNTITITALTEQLQEKRPERGALFCDYEVFKFLYHSEARMLSRRGESIHIAMISLESRNGKELTKRSLNLAMDNLQNIIRMNLRLGDAVARCSGTQFVIMLPQANYENSNNVCERIRQKYFREYPHSPIQLTFIVQPLNPLVAEERGSAREIEFTE